MAEAAPFLEAGYEVVACWEDAAAILRAPAEGGEHRFVLTIRPILHRGRRSRSGRGRFAVSINYTCLLNPLPAPMESRSRVSL